MSVETTLAFLALARDRLAEELAAETLNRLTDQANGRGVKTTYTANGRNVQWNEYLKTMKEMICELDECIAAITNRENPYEVRSTGVT